MPRPIRRTRRGQGNASGRERLNYTRGGRAGRAQGKPAPLREVPELKRQRPAKDSHGKDQEQEAGGDDAEGAAVAEEVVSGFRVNA